MKQFLLFDTLQAAQTANEQISSQMQFADGTQTWAQPMQTNTGKYCFAKPSDEYMVGVTDYTELPFDRTWFEEETGA